MNPLDANEVRVLGALAEKAVTTPAYYPLTLNALVNACNQTSNRDPVVSFDERTVVRALDSLRAQKLAYIFSGADSRVPKYGQKLAEILELNPGELAAMVVLMLRGPQTVGEIRSRSGRLHEFASLEEVEATLANLSARSPALVMRLPRQAGFKESRYAHLLSGEPLVTDSPDAGLPSEPATLAVRAEEERIAALEQQVDDLRKHLADLEARFAEFRRQFD